VVRILVDWYFNNVSRWANTSIFRYFS